MRTPLTCQQGTDAHTDTGEGFAAVVLRGSVTLFTSRHQVVLLTVLVLLRDRWKTVTPHSVMPTVEAEKVELLSTFSGWDEN